MEYRQTSAITPDTRRFDASQGPRKVGPADGPVAQLGGCDARFLVFGEESGGGFSLVEHPVPPRSLCAPRHRHHGVDEYSFVLEGRMGALLGRRRDLRRGRRPRLQAARPVAHLLERRRRAPPHPRDHLPGRLRALLPRVRRGRTKDGTFDPVALGERFAIEFDMESLPAICAEHGLVHPLLATA